MTATLVLPESITAEIEAHLTLTVESAGVLLARRMDLEDGDMRLLARAIYWVPEDAYEVRSADRMSIRSDGYVEALAIAERDGAIAIWFHTHPGGAQPLPSQADREVDAAIAGLFQLRSGAGIYGAMIASMRGSHLALSANLQFEDGRTLPIDRFWIVGERWRLIRSFVEHDPTDPADMFDRNVRAFGHAIQRTLGELRVAIVGAGGTGSAIAEQIIRLGVRHLLLIDGDTLSLSNVTRVYGATPRDVNRPKVEVLRDHLTSIAPDLDCGTVRGMITLQRVAKNLRSVDLVFGCTDDNAGRLVLSRFATYFLTPLIDVGVLLSSDANGSLTGIDGRVTVLSPGAACLVCRDRVDSARAAAELMTPDERIRLANEGYAPALGQTEPAVVAFTTAVAAAAVNELLERLIGYGADERPGEILLRIHEREISSNKAAPRSAHYCAQQNGRWGAGDEEPFLGQLWSDL